jgi:hypothetical protein
MTIAVSKDAVAMETNAGTNVVQRQSVMLRGIKVDLC